MDTVGKLKSNFQLANRYLYLVTSSLNQDYVSSNSALEQIFSKLQKSKRYLNSFLRILDTVRQFRKNSHWKILVAEKALENVSIILVRWCFPLKNTSFQSLDKIFLIFIASLILIRVFLASAFQEKCPTLQIVLFRHVRSPFLFIFSTWTMDVQNILKTSEPRLNQNRRQKPLKHTKDPPLAILVLLTSIFFDTTRHFSKKFWLHQKVPLHFFDLLQQNGCLNIPNSPPSTFPALWQCSKFSFLVLFRKF